MHAGLQAHHHLLNIAHLDRTAKKGREGFSTYCLGIGFGGVGGWRWLEKGSDGEVPRWKADAKQFIREKRKEWKKEKVTWMCLSSGQQWPLCLTISFRFTPWRGLFLMSQKKNVFLGGGLARNWVDSCKLFEAKTVSFSFALRCCNIVLTTVDSDFFLWVVRRGNSSSSSSFTLKYACPAFGHIWSSTFLFCFSQLPEKECFVKQRGAARAQLHFFSLLIYTNS